MPTDAVLTLDAAQLPEGTCYNSEQERFNGFVAALRVMLPGNYGTTNQGSSTPSLEDRDKPWIRTNVDGSPDGLYTWSTFDGRWERPHPLSPGAIMLWLGSDVAVDTLDGGSAGAVTTVSGPFWEIATEFQARFPIGVGTLPSAGPIAVTDVGGEERHTLVTKELPSVLGSLGTDVVKALGKESGVGGAGFSVAGPWMDLDLAEFIVGGTPDVDKSHNNLPPFIACYMIRRTQRLYYSI